MDPKKIYQQLHALAEPSLKEFQTSAFLLNQLKSNGFSIKAQVETGIVASYDTGKPGPTIGLRADMDALKYVIDGQVEYRHCCGHDANMTMVLTAAIKSIEAGINQGELVLIFQPAEETLQGARLMANSGEIPALDALYGIHLRPIAETELGQATPALYHGASHVLKIGVKGKSAHGARPHLGINAIEAVVDMVTAINAIKIDPRISHSVKITTIRGGETTNIIPDYAEFALDIRVQTNQGMRELKQKIFKALDGVCLTTGANYQILYDDGCMAAIYDDHCMSVAKKAIEQVLGQSKAPIVTPGGEDFHYYADILGVKAAYLGIGADLEPGLHAVDMHFNLKALDYGSDILTQILIHQLSSN